MPEESKPPEEGKPSDDVVESEESRILKKLRTRAQEGVTVPEMIPKYMVDKKIEEAKDELRKEWMQNIDRRAIDAVQAAADHARTHSEQAVKTSHRRWMTLIVVHVCEGILMGLLMLFAALQWAYAQHNRELIKDITDVVSDNRARIQRLEEYLLQNTHEVSPQGEKHEDAVRTEP